MINIKINNKPISDILKKATEETIKDLNFNTIKVSNENLKDDEKIISKAIENTPKIYYKIRKVDFYA